MKTTIYKETEVDISPEEVTRNIVNNLKNDNFELEDLVKSYLIEELPDYIYNVTDEYDPTDEEFDKICELALPKLKEIYNNQLNKFKSSELGCLSNKQDILDWIDCVCMGANEDQPGFWLSSEEILNAILENGTKSGF